MAQDKDVGLKQDCAVCGERTEGSMSAAGVRHPGICPADMEIIKKAQENKA